jgi:hypothetical protein
MLRRHGIQAVTRIMAYIADAVTMRTGGFIAFELLTIGSSALTSSTLIEMAASNTVWL